MADAYDCIAATYDDRVIEDAWMRRQLWRRYDRLFPAESHVLDLACGTGLDTLHLASGGRRVTAVDVSPAMTGRLRAKLERHPPRHPVRVLNLDLAELDGLLDALDVPDGSAAPELFDGAVSAFAGLNTVPDLERLAASLAKLLRPGARGVLHMLAPAGAWRCLRHMLRYGPRAALRERRRRERRVEIEGHVLHHRLLDLGAAAEALGQHLRVVRAGSLGVLWSRPLGRHLQAGPVADALGRLDHAAGGLWPLRHCGRFHVLEVERP